MLVYCCIRGVLGGHLIPYGVIDRYLLMVIIFSMFCNAGALVLLIQVPFFVFCRRKGPTKAQGSNPAKKNK